MLPIEFRVIVPVEVRARSTFKTPVPSVIVRFPAPVSRAADKTTLTPPVSETSSFVVLSSSVTSTVNVISERRSMLPFTPVSPSIVLIVANPRFSVLRNETSPVAKSLRAAKTSTSFPSNNVIAPPAVESWMTARFCATIAPSISWVMFPFDVRVVTP